MKIDYSKLEKVAYKVNISNKNSNISRNKPRKIPLPNSSSTRNSKTEVVIDTTSTSKPIRQDATGPITDSKGEEELQTEELPRLRPRKPFNYYKSKAKLATSSSNSNIENTIYSYTSSAYLASKKEEDKTILEGETSSKIIIKKPNSYILEPKTYEEAISENNPYKEDWIRSMQKELDTLELNNTWKSLSEPLEPRPSKTKQLPNNSITINPIKTRWVYKIKDLKTTI